MSSGRRTPRVAAIGLGLLAGLLVLPSSLAPLAAMAATTGGSGATCRHTTYSGDGGYYSGGFFFWEPGDTVTLVVHWCSAGGAITSKDVTYTSNIPASLDPRFSESDGFSRGTKVLKVAVSGSYESGVLNNSGSILLVGHVTAGGLHHFSDDTADQG